MNERTELSEGDMGRIYFLGELVKAPVAMLEWERQFAVSFVSEPRPLDHEQRDAVEKLRDKYPLGKAETLKTEMLMPA
jgi:hypothetical protein